MKFYKENLGDGIDLVMVYIQGGSFYMGTPDWETISAPEERPQHLVTLTPFFMSCFLITQDQWKAISENTNLKVNIDLPSSPAFFEGNINPVEQISWYEANEFCDRLSKLTGKKYDLPSESQWEYACRAVIFDGTTLEDWNEKYYQSFSFGNNITTEFANFARSKNKTSLVGTYKPNAFGLYDMHGNLWEWCKDDNSFNYKYAPTNGNAHHNETTRFTKVTRGGSWYSDAESCRSASRLSYSNDFKCDTIGFRVVSNCF